MKKWKLYTIVIVIIAFIGSNLFLLFKEESKVVRTAYIKDWSVVKKDDIKKTFKTKGVVKPEEEHYVYYDEERGPFASFLVKEGDPVSAGTALFTYGSNKLEDEEAEIEAEIAQIDDEIDSVESQISDLEKIDTTSADESSASSTSKDKTVNVNIDVNVDVSPIAEAEVEQAIVEAEAEKEKLEAKLSKYEDELIRVKEKLENVTINSEVDGQVIAINEDVQNPVITIASSAISVEGDLTEQQMKKAAVEQEVYMYSSLHNEKYKGTIQKVVSYPKGSPSIDKETKYPFVVQLDKEAENLLPGAKLHMTVVVDEAKNVPVVANKSTFKVGKNTNVYQLTEKGMVEEQKITPGISFAGQLEIKKGLKAGQFIATKPGNVEVANTAFITPLTTTNIRKKEIKKLTKKQIVKYTLMGVFEK